jgi:hypothetical protein
MSNPNKFFQNESKFIVGNTYETLRVNQGPYNRFNTQPCDEVGTVIPNTCILLGKYESSYSYGHGDNRGRRDTFMASNGQQVSNYLDYDGKTRYREIKSYMDERIDFLKLIESTGEKRNVNNKNEHINTFLFNEVISKEICSFMNPAAL